MKQTSECAFFLSDAEEAFVFSQLLFKKEIMCIFVLHNQGLSMAFMGPFLKFVHFGLWAAFLALSHVGSWLATAKR